MARYRDALCRLCRREGDKLFLKGDRCFTDKCAVERRKYSPGQHGQRRKKLSDYALQLREKQKAKETYGVLEKQFKRYFYMADKKKGGTGSNLLQLLESRLDNVVYRLGFADSRAQARQLVQHGHILLNGRKTNIPSCLVKEGDTISWREGSIKTEYYKQLVESIEAKSVVNWLKLDIQNLVGQVLSLPTPEDVGAKFDGKAVVAYYSR